MLYISTEITIQASLETVWNHLTNFPAYTQWNPFIIQASGLAKEGEKLNLTMQLTNGKTMVFRPKVLAASTNLELRWLGHLGIYGLFDGEHSFELRETPKGVVVHQSERFSGLLARPMLHFIRENTQQNFEAMNKALKQLAEKNHGLTEVSRGLASSSLTKQ